MDFVGSVCPICTILRLPQRAVANELKFAIVLLCVFNVLPDLTIKLFDNRKDIVYNENSGII